MVIARSTATRPSPGAIFCAVLLRPPPKDRGWRCCTRTPGWQSLSKVDHDTEHGYAHIAHQYTGCALLGITLAGADKTWSARIWSRGETSPQWAETVRVVGPKLEVSWNDDLRPPPWRTAAQVRTISAWGPARHDAIVRLRVLVVGLGSVGLDVAQRLAATGITDIGVMDYDVIKELNRDRMIEPRDLTHAGGGTR